MRMIKLLPTSAICAGLLLGAGTAVADARREALHGRGAADLREEVCEFPTLW